MSAGNLAGQRSAIWAVSDGSLIQGQAYWGSAPVEFYSGSKAHFQHLDWLGSERVITGYNGATEGSFTNLPFGDGYTASGTDWGIPYHLSLGHPTAAQAAVRGLLLLLLGWKAT